MNNNRPSKKIVAFAIVAFGLVSAIYVSKLVNKNPSLLTFARDRENLALDFSFRNTVESPRVFDSSLGTSTNSEIADLSGDDSSLTENLTVSDIFSRDLYSKFTTIQNYGDITDATQQKELVTNLVQEVQSAFSYRQYSMGGLQTITMPTQNDIRFYATSFATLQLDLFKELEKNIPKIKYDEKVAAKIYADFATSLYNLKVPSAIAIDHLSVINNMSAVSAVFYSTANYEKDPVVALSAIQQYKGIQAKQITALQSIAQYIRSNGIIFTDGEIGNFWNNF